MKLIGLMLVKNDDWVLGLSLRAALKWCDAVVVMDAKTTDNSKDIIAKIKEESPEKVFLMTEAQDSKASNSDLMEVLLHRARSEEATHISILHPNEVLTSNILRIKEDALKLREGEMLSLPAFYCWKSINQYRSDKSIWSNVLLPVAFKDSHAVSWKGASDKERPPRGPQWNIVSPISTDIGGILNLENANWKMARAKYFVLEMREILRRPPWKHVAEVNRAHPLDETGIKLSRVPDEWYKEFSEHTKSVFIGNRSSYEDEITAIIGAHGHERFSSIKAPTETVGFGNGTVSPAPKVVQPPPKITQYKQLSPPQQRRVDPGARRYVKEEPKLMYSKKIVFPRNTIRWSGHLLDYSGYGKANREFLFRMANTFNIALDPVEIGREPVLVDERTRARVMSHISSQPPEGFPYIRFFGPRKEDHSGKKVCFTMMETYGTHHDLVSLLNRYDEVWVPTAWNKSVFESSGVTSPVKTVPLGINPLIYKPGEKRLLPPSILITTDRRGTREIPGGFIFINTSNPSFRKGIDVTLKAFDDAFKGDPNVSLVLCVSYSSIVHCDPFALIPGGYEACKSKVYILDGKMDEYQMADMYRASDAYVTASRGEGWNLPLMEASACGLPVIAPLAFSHNEFLTESNAFTFLPDGKMQIPDAEKISPWYKDQFFVHYGEKSIETLSGLMRAVFENKELSEKKAKLLRSEILEKYTWDIVAEKASRMIAEVIS